MGYNGQDTTALLTQYFTVGEHIVTITAKDTSGNIATKDILIDVNDTSIPTIICVENLVISLIEIRDNPSKEQLSRTIAEIYDQLGYCFYIQNEFEIISQFL